MRVLKFDNDQAFFWFMSQLQTYSLIVSYMI